MSISTSTIVQQPSRSPSPTYDISIDLDTIVAITKIPKKQILKMIELKDLLSSGATISHRKLRKDGRLIKTLGVRTAIVEDLFGAEMVGKFLSAGEDY